MRNKPHLAAVQANKNALVLSTKRFRGDPQRDISIAYVASMLAFIGGGIVLNVFKEELPDERERRPAPFLAGLAGFATLLRVI